MTNIERRMEKLEKQITGETLTEKEIEAERVAIERAEIEAKRRLEGIARRQNEP